MSDVNENTKGAANPPAEEMSEQQMSELLQIRRDKLKALQDEGKDPFVITTWEQTHHAQEIVDNFEALEGQAVSVAGRIMTWRDMGKASFIDMRDESGRIQIYVRINDVGEETYAAFGGWDIGDIVGIKGTVFRTRRGEISVHATELKLLSKSLLPCRINFTALRILIPVTVSGMWISSLTLRCGIPLSSVLRFCRKSAVISPNGLSWRWRPLFFIILPAAPQHGPLLPITTRWIWTCTSALHWSFT